MAIDPQTLAALQQSLVGGADSGNVIPSPGSLTGGQDSGVVSQGSNLSSQQQPANNAQNAGPVKAGLRGVLAGMLKRFSYGGGQAMIAASGGETDAEKSVRLATTAHLNAQTQLAQAQAQMVPVQLPNGTVVHLPSKMASDLMKQQLANTGKTDVADINSQAQLHKPLTIPGVGGFTWDDTKNGYTPIQGAQIPQHQLAPGEADQLGFPSSTTQVPEATYVQAKGLQMRGSQTRTGGVWKETSPGEWNFLPTSTTTTRGTPAPTAPNATPNATPAAPGAANHPLLNNPNVPPRVKHFLGGGPIYAYDPKTGDTVLTTPAEEAKNGYTNPRKASATEIMNDTQLNNRLTDVATKVQRYEEAMNAPISSYDRTAIAGILASDKFKLGAEAFGTGIEIPVDRFNQLLDAGQASSISPAAKNALLAYLNARESMMGYTRVLTGSSRGSDTSLGLNLQALPSPVMPNDYIKNGVEQFKQNISLAGRGLPRMPGIPQAKDVLAQAGQSASESSAPSVRVRLTDGRTGTIPASSLPKYQKLGATIIK